LFRIASECPQPVGSLEMHLQVPVTIQKPQLSFLLQRSLINNKIILNFVGTKFLLATGMKNEKF
jgi:hypothetical protein